MQNEIVPSPKKGNRLLFQLRWFFFVLAAFGLFLLAFDYLVAIYWFFQQSYYWRTGYLAPFATMMIALGSPMFLALSYLTHQSQMRLTSSFAWTRDVPLLDYPLLRQLTKEGWIRSSAFYLISSSIVATALLLTEVPNLSFYWKLGYLVPWARGIKTIAFLYLPMSTLLLGLFSATTLVIGCQVPTLAEAEDVKLLAEPDSKRDEEEDKGSVAIVAAHQKEVACCPVCRTTVEQEPHLCPRCHTVHHEECWAYAGGCAIFGCENKGKSLVIREDKNFLTLKEKTEQWLQVATINWYGFTMATLGFVAFTWSALFPLTVYHFSLLHKLAFYFGQVTYFGGISMAILGLLAYCLSLIPLLQKSSSLKEVADLVLQPPQNEGREVLNRLETGPRTKAVLSMLVIAPAVSLTTIMLLPLLYAISANSFNVISISYRLAIVVMGIVFTLGLWAAARKRALFQQSIQNRVEASLLTMKNKEQ